MRTWTRVLITTLVMVLVVVAAFAVARSDNRLGEIAGATVLVALAAWITVTFSRWRRRLVKR